MTWIYYRSILKLVTHPLPSSYTYPPITIQMNLFKYLFFPFLILLFLTHIKKILWSSLCDPYLHDYIYDQKSPPSTSNIPWPPHQYYTNPDFLTKNPARSLFYISTVHPPTKQHTRLPPIISNIPSITLHTSTSHLIKIHHNSQTFIIETYLHCTKCAWVKIDLTPSPRQHMEIQGGGIVILNGASRSQNILRSSINKKTTMKFSLSLLKTPFIEKLHTVWYPTFVHPSYHWHVAFHSRTSQ